MPSKQPNKKLLFVYGSLKRGFDNHQLLKNATFIAESKTLQPYSMFVETHGQYPYLLKNRPFHQIEGELYQAQAYFFVEEKIPKQQEPLKVWTMNNDYFLDAFEAYYQKSV